MRFIRDIARTVAQACGAEENVAEMIGDGAATTSTVIRTFFGMGTPCHYCAGKGYTRWPSSGEIETCYFCSGSGIREA